MSAVALAKAELPYTLSRAPLRRRASTFAEATMDLAEAPPARRRAVRVAHSLSLARVAGVWLPSQFGLMRQLVPALRDEMLTLSNFTGHPSLTLRAGFVNVSEARSDWAPDPRNPLPKFSPPRRVPHGVTLVGRLFDEGTVARAALCFRRPESSSTTRRY